MNQWRDGGEMIGGKAGEGEDFTLQNPEEHTASRFVIVLSVSVENGTHDLGPRRLVVRQLGAPPYCWNSPVSGSVLCHRTSEAVVSLWQRRGDQCTPSAFAAFDRRGAAFFDRGFVAIWCGVVEDDSWCSTGWSLGNPRND